MKKIKIYTTETCSLCHALKEFLKEHKVKFEEIDISKDEKLQKEIIEKSGSIYVPIIEIDGKIIIGFDK